MICTLCKEHPLPFGALCPACTRELQARLASLPRLWAALEAWLSPAVRGLSQYGGRTAMVEAPLPLAEEVLDLRAAGGIVGVLEDWHDAVCASRELGTRPRTGSLALRVNTAAWGLIHHIYFIALWDQAPVLGREICDLVDRVRRVVQPDDATPKRTILGRCITIDAAGVECGSTLYADVGKPVQCGRCLCPYPPESWLALKSAQPAQAGADEDHVDEPELAAA
jgi:hypothetical protein